MLLLAPQARAQPVTVFAASSLTDVMRDIAAAWVYEGHAEPRLSFGASSTLVRQIEQGAPANLFISADLAWMDYLDTRGLIAAGTRVSLLGNTLVLIMPANRSLRVAVTRDLDLEGLLGPDGRLAIGDPAHVPVGVYTKQALEVLGLWERTATRLAPTRDARATLLLVERGEAPAGVVYATDAEASQRVAVAGIFPADSHPPIVYPAAVTRAGDTQAARDFLTFLSSPQARVIFASRGFKLP